MKTPRLKIFRERPIVGCGCCTKPLTADEMKGFRGGYDSREVGSLYMRLKEEYKGRLEVEFYDPRCFIFLIDTLRYGLRGGEVTWVLGNKVLRRGVPSWEELKSDIDAALAS